MRRLRCCNSILTLPSRLLVSAVCYAGVALVAAFVVGLIDAERCRRLSLGAATAVRLCHILQIFELVQQPTLRQHPVDARQYVGFDVRTVREPCGAHNGCWGPFFAAFLIDAVRFNCGVLCCGMGWICKLRRLSDARVVHRPCRFFALNTNRLLSGSIPSTLGNLAALRYAYIG